MNKKRNMRQVSLLFTLVFFAMVSYAQKPATKEEKKLSFSDLTYNDIGRATKSGTSATDKDEIEIIAGGSDIWEKHDEFRFGYQKLKGDFDLRVQVLSLSSANTYTKAGIMARADLSDSSQHVYFQVFPDNSPRNNNKGGCEFQYRLAKGVAMKAIYPDLKTAGNQFDVSFPKTWIRLKRKGDVFESYFSNDNITWSFYSTFTLKMPEELLVGLAVTAHNSTVYTTAKFAMVRLIK